MGGASLPCCYHDCNLCSTWQVRTWYRLHAVTVIVMCVKWTWVWNVCRCAPRGKRSVSPTQNFSAAADSNWSNYSNMKRIKRDGIVLFIDLSCVWVAIVGHTFFVVCLFQVLRVLTPHSLMLQIPRWQIIGLGLRMCQSATIWGKKHHSWVLFLCEWG